MPVKYIQGDLFKAARPSILAHACNTHGIWGGGIAYQFALKYPAAETVYERHCAAHLPQDLLGTTLLINTDPSEPGNEGGVPHIIACLFTSIGGGGSADSPKQIVESTRRAIKDLERQLKGTQDELLLKVKEREGEWVVDMPKINAGIFRVPWEETAEVLQEAELDYNVYVL